MRKCVKFSAAILAIVMILSVLPTISFAADVVDSGFCGENVTWVLDSDGVLTISGTGDMQDFGYEDAYETPWFDYIYDIKAVVIEEGVTSIGGESFWICLNLSSVEIPSSVTTIKNGAFEWCSSLESVELPKGVVSIGKYAFSYCSSLTSVKIPDSVVSIGEDAFFDCASLIDVTIGSGVETIDDFAFNYCTLLEKIEVDENNKNFSSVDGVLFNKEKTELITYPNSHGAKYSIPEGVVSIGEGAFYGCGALASVEIPNSVKSIGEDAFYGCYKLKNIAIPNSVTEIGYGAFWDCTSLKKITIPDSVKKIESYTFFYCASLKSVTIPKSVTIIDECAFTECESLTDVYYEGSEDDWLRISIDWGNDLLYEADASFNYVSSHAIVDSGDFEDVAQWELNGDDLLSIELDETVEGGTTVVVSIGEGNEVESITIVEGTSGEVNVKNTKMIKIFVWDSLAGMKPLCEVKEIKID